MINFNGAFIASNPRGKTIVADNTRTGQTTCYSDWDIKEKPVAVLKDHTGQIVDVVDVYQRNKQWYTDDLEVAALQG